jgi:hypothetical protein
MHHSPKTWFRSSKNRKMLIALHRKSIGFRLLERRHTPKLRSIDTTTYRRRNGGLRNLAVMTGRISYRRTSIIGPLLAGRRQIVSCCAELRVAATGTLAWLRLSKGALAASPSFPFLSSPVMRPQVQPILGDLECLTGAKGPNSPAIPRWQPRTRNSMPEILQPNGGRWAPATRSSIRYRIPVCALKAASIIRLSMRMVQHPACSVVSSRMPAHALTGCGKFGIVLRQASS